MVSPKWQTMSIESQHCSKGIANGPLVSQQTTKLLEDLITSCCSPNKAVQVEALKCWGMWIHNQNSDAWKAKAVCFTAIRPLIPKKLQPLHKDVDICKLKLSLMWALLVKVQDIMQLEGPQYILEVFLQSCLTCLSSTSGDDSEKDISLLVFQLLLAVFNKNETLTGCDKEVFPPLSSDILHIKKVFYQLADIFLSIFVHWRKVEDKTVIIKIWRHFLELCEQSNEHIPIPFWHKLFKLAGRICAEKDEPVKERLAFLHSCATTLKSALSSSKFIDFGNLLTTPCEVFLKKLVELCTTECNEIGDSEMFFHSKEICQALSDKSVAINGYDVCIGVLDALEEFCLRSLFWGVWCGLVHCYKVLLGGGAHQNQLTKVETKFYRKLRGVVVNFELDRKDLHEDCVKEVERHIGFLNIGCLCSFRSAESHKTEALNGSEHREKSTGLEEKRGFSGVSNALIPVLKEYKFGKCSLVPFQREKCLFIRKKTLSINFDLVKDILSALTINSTKSVFSPVLAVQFMSMQSGRDGHCSLRSLSLPRNMGVSSKKEIVLDVSCRVEKAPTSSPEKMSALVPSSVDQYKRDKEKVISTPTTRSKKRAEEERKKELEVHKRRKRKSFEVLVQEIVRKNKERKTENSRRRKSPDGLKGKRERRKIERQPEKNSQKVGNVRGKGKKSTEGCGRRLRNSKKVEQPKRREKRETNSWKKEVKLENYFRVIRKKSGDEEKKQVKKPSRAKKCKRNTTQSTCCRSEKEERERKGEIGWRQTSLKTMMNPKSKAEKIRQGIRTRDKTTEAAEEKPKTTSDCRKALARPLAKLSPFKEVFHDHEYAKMTQPEKMETLWMVPFADKRNNSVESKRKRETVKTEKKTSGSELVVRRRIYTLEEEKILKMEKPPNRGDESADVEAPTLLTVQISTESQESELRKAAFPEFVASGVQEVEANEATKRPQFEIITDSLINEFLSTEEESNKPKSDFFDADLQILPIRIQMCRDENEEKFSESESTPDNRGKKRLRTSEIVEESKRMKLEEGGVIDAMEELPEEKLPLEVAEKENLEERREVLASPMKKEKCASLPQAGSGGMSRALRIIGLVPESTKARSWESCPRTEALRCIKAPNVDRNSRASKMLALLSENTLELEEAMKGNQEENIRSGAMAITPNAQTPLSSLKSPKSVKKRRSIRFDDARNETVIYQTDTPPSQILEEKEKRRGMRPFGIALN